MSRGHVVSCATGWSRKVRACLGALCRHLSADTSPQVQPHGDLRRHRDAPVEALRVLPARREPTIATAGNPSNTKELPVTCPPHADYTRTLPPPSSTAPDLGSLANVSAGTRCSKPNMIFAKFELALPASVRRAAGQPGASQP